LTKEKLMSAFLEHRTLTVSSTVIPEILGQPALMPVKLEGTEALNGLFSYALELRTPDQLNLNVARAANFDLHTFIGKELSVGMELAGGNLNDPRQREINALITQARLLGNDGRLVRYELTLQPWLVLASLNSDCRIYQDRTVVEILDELLGRYAYPVDKRLIEDYPVRDYQTQFNESDYQFFCRLCEEWGINWFFEHHDGKHCLVLSDNMAAHRDNPGVAYRQIDYHPHGRNSDRECIEHFIPAHSLAAGIYSTRDYDYTQPRADLGASSSMPHDTVHQHQEVYAWHAGTHYSQPQAGNGRQPNDAQQEARLLARLRMETLRQCGLASNGRGPLRGMVPGCRFRLQGHPQDVANSDYLITEVTLLIEDVDQQTQSAGASSTYDAQTATRGYRVQAYFTAHPLNEAFRPQRHTPKPCNAGVQTALVVGPSEQSIWTDQYGRIKVQFPWDRQGQNDQNSSCWIRVSSPWAGNQLGAMQLPRIGQEVVVSFIGGNPDLPLCTGRVHNQNNFPPWQLPQQSALSGLRSRELGDANGNASAGRSNHLILDDTEQQIQAQLKSDHLHSQLSLGHITRIENHQGRQDARGEGFELRTDGHGALRATKGLLLSTDGRAAAGGGMLSRNELLEGLTQAITLATNLGDNAAAHQGTQRQLEQSQQLSHAVEALGDGCGDEAEQRHAVAGGQALIALSAPAGIASSTQGQQLHYAGKNIDSVAGGNQQHYAMGDILHTAAHAIEHYACGGDLRQIAERGKMQLQAQHNSMELTAQRDLTITSSSAGVLLQAEKQIVLQVGDSYLRITPDQIVIDAKTVKIQSDAPLFTGAQGGMVDLPRFSKGDAERRFIAHFGGSRNDAAADHNYRIHLKDGKLIEGVTDAQGRTALAEQDAIHIATIEIWKETS
jgi:type VI secretion system secreted protein VgrG